MQTIEIIEKLAYAHDVMAAILVFQNNQTAAILVYQTNPVAVQLSSNETVMLRRCGVSQDN